jgi:hypothetical protein
MCMVYKNPTVATKINTVSSLTLHVYDKILHKIRAFAGYVIIMSDSLLTFCCQGVYKSTVYALCTIARLGDEGARFLMWVVCV